MAAELCLQCAWEVGDMVSVFEDRAAWDLWKAGRARIVKCEDCGMTVVDPEGRCVGPCSKRHGLRVEAAEVKERAEDEKT